MSDRPAVFSPILGVSARNDAFSSKRGARRPLLLLLTFLALAACGQSSAWAQAAADTAKIIVRVRNSQNALAPIEGAAVNLFSETERPQSQLTDASGIATFPTAPVATYSIAVSAVGFRPIAPRDGIVAAAGQTVNVDFVLQPVGPTEIESGSRVELLDRTNTSEYAIRKRSFWTDFPVGVGNRQSLSRILRSVPGFVPNSLDQVHARGESPITNATYLDGFLLPQFAALPVNRAFFLPDAVDSLEVQTGGYAPETGQASGSATKITSRANPYYFNADVTLKGGQYGTFEDYVTVGGSLRGFQDNRFREAAKSAGTLRIIGDREVVGNRVLPANDAPASLANRNVSFLISLSQRYTDYGSETPQSGGQTANNRLESEAFFGKFTYNLNPSTEVSALLNYVSGRTNSPNRTDDGGPNGAGFGFGGQQNRSSGLASQDAQGLQIRQKDNNSLNVLQLKRRTSKGALLSTSVGVTRSALDIDNRASRAQASNNLPFDNSVEYLPTLNSKYDQIAIQADYTFAPFIAKKTGDIHNVKMGIVYHDITDNEGYQFLPQSQIALTTLGNIEPAFLADGAFDSSGTFRTTGNNPQPRVVTVRREGFYGAAYLQDTWRIFAPLTLNYGARADFYEMNIKDIKTEVTAYGGIKDDVSKTEISPRFNLALVLPNTSRLNFLRAISRQPTILRVSYNRLFVTPSLAQGDIIPNQGARGPLPGISGSPSQITLGQSVVPQITDAYNASLERQFGSRVIAKAGIYHKDITNAVASKQLIPLLQTGLVSSANLGDVTVDGGELSLELLPPAQGKNGFHGYFTYANATAAPKSENEVTNLNQSNSTPFLEWDQNHTFNLGIAYTTRTGASAGLNLYLGSGLYASSLTGGGVIVRDGNREGIQELNLRLASGMRPLRGGRSQIGLELQVENVLDGRARLNYQSYLTGTRYQQSRRILGAITGRF